MTRILTVSRVQVELSPKFHPDGGQFMVRRLKLSPQLVAKLTAHTERHSLGPEDLLFTVVRISQPSPRLKVIPNPGQLGLTEPNDAGRRYPHGTLTASTAGRCRCAYCRGAFAVYRAKRRASGEDPPRESKIIDPEDRISRRWFRDHIWLAALDAANLGIRVRVHDLRHAHASWLLAGGADLAVVKEQLGHSDILRRSTSYTPFPTRTKLRSMLSARSVTAVRGSLRNPSCLARFILLMSGTRCTSCA